MFSTMNDSVSSCNPLVFSSCSVFLTAVMSLYFFPLPLCVFVLHVFHQRWRSSAAVSASHTDVFTVHMVVSDLLDALGVSLHLASIYSQRCLVSRAAVFILSSMVPGQTLFHIFTCVDRYLAVVHPVTYLGLRTRGGVCIRNVGIGCVWLLCIVWGILYLQTSSFAQRLLDTCLAVFAFVFVLYCCLSVLCVLIRPKPGDVGGAERRADQSKKKAFHTMVAVMAALLLRFWAKLVSDVISVSRVEGGIGCLVLVMVIGLHMPSTLVLPLLFLQRAGKLPHCPKKSARAA